MQITRTAKGEIALAQPIQMALYGTAIIDLVIGLLFFLSSKIDVDLWPSDIPILLTRFIGAIVLGNAVGAFLIAQQGTWEGARGLFGVAWVYGVLIFIGLLVPLLRGNAKDTFWIYVIVDAIFLVPISYIIWTYENAFRASKTD